MEIRVLGPLDVGKGGAPTGRRDRVVLEVLVIRAGIAVSGDQLADAVWADTAPESAAKVLQGCILRLRRLLGYEAIETAPGGYRLNVPAQDIDARRFETLLNRARRMLGVEEPERTEYLAGQALAMWRGAAYADLEEWQPGRIEADRLNELRLEAEELRVDACLRTGRFRDVLADAQAMVAAAPLRERRWGLLALSHYQAGNQSEALRIIRHVRTLLADQLGLDPNPELDTLERAILRQDPTLAVAEVQEATCERSPYLGLRSYDVDDSDSFFGRDAEVSACLRRLEVGGSLAVVGPSGSGKSSLVRAGVAASMRREGRTVVILEPGATPWQALAAVDVGREGLVVVVDQCEEVFALCADHAERGAFLDALVEHAACGPLVIALRADHLADVTAFPGFARHVEQSLHLLTPMTEEYLREAIEQPARMAGLKIEPGLTDLLIREVDHEPGALPLLSHALQETWKRREGSMLTVDGYRASGGIKSAVAFSAEKVYASTPPEVRHLLRDLLMRLVAPGAGGEPVRSRVPRRLVITDPAQGDLLDSLVAARLVTSDEGVVELAHEAVARAWPRLQGWLDDDVDGLRILHHVSGVADAWEGLGRPDSELYRGVRLAEAIQWRERSRPALSHIETAFLDASQRLAEAEERSGAMRAQRQARMIRRLRAALGSAAVLLIVALTSSLLAAQEARQSQASRDRAIRAEAVADAHRLGAQALISADTSLASLLAAEALRLKEDPATRTNAWDVLAGQPNLIWASAPLGHEILGLSVSADGSRIASYDTSNRISVLNSTEGALVSRISTGGRVATYPQGPLEFNPREPQLAVGAQGATVPALQLLDSRNLRPLRPVLPGQPQRPAEVWDIDYSSSGRYLAASFNEKRADNRTVSSIRVWDLAHPNELPKVVSVAPGTAGRIAVSDDGRWVCDGWPLAAYRVSDGQRLYRDANLLTFSQMGFDPSGRTLAVGPSVIRPPSWFPPANRLQLIDARSGAQKGTIAISDRRAVAVSAAQYSHDGSLIAVATGEPSVQIWGAGGGAGAGAQELTLPSVSSNALAFSPDDRTLLTGGRDGVVRAWDLMGRHSAFSQLLLPTQGRVAGDPTVAPNGGLLALDAWNSSRSIVDLRSGQIRRLRHDEAGWPLANGQPDGAAWTPDGSSYAVGGTDLSTSAAEGLVELFDDTGGGVRRVRVPAPVTGMSYSADASQLIVTELTGRIDILDGSSLHRIAPAITVAGAACCVATSHDGTLAAVLVASGQAALGSSPRWDRWAVVNTKDGSTVNTGSLPGTSALAVALSPDGQRMAVAMADGTMRLMDAATGSELNSTVSRNGHPISFVAFDDSGALIASSDADGALTLWDGVTGALLESLPMGHSGAPVFIDAGPEILLGTEVGSAFSWRFGLDQIEPALCRAAGRNLTPSEWTTYLPGRPYEKTCPTSR